MSFPGPPFKRPYDHSIDPIGSAKRSKSSTFHPRQPSAVLNGDTVFRVLCPVSKPGSLVGEVGSVVSQIREETGTKITVEEGISGYDERLIVIMASENDLKGPERMEDGINVNRADDDEDDNNSNSDEGDKIEEHKEADQNSVDKDDEEGVGNSTLEKASSSCQKALLLVFERILVEESEPDGADEEDKRSSPIVARLLVPSSQVGCLMGKGGSVIKQMSVRSEAQIRISRDKLPPFASPMDELIQISGRFDAVKKALHMVSKQLLDNPPRDREYFRASSFLGAASHPFPSIHHPEMLHPRYQFPGRGIPYPGRPHDLIDYHPNIAPHGPIHDGAAPDRLKISPEILMFRLLCVNEKVGGIIGKGGSIIRSLQLETGTDIKILEGDKDSDDRIIVISAAAYPDERISPSQDALLRLQSRIVKAAPDSGKEKAVVSRLLVSSSQIGCLLGKGGSIIAEMRKVTGAQIRILGKDQTPQCAAEDEEVVQITGEFEVVQEALMQISARLRDHLFRDSFPTMSFPVDPVFSDQIPSLASYTGRRGPLGPGLYSTPGPSFDIFPPHDERDAIIHRPGLGRNIPDRRHSSTSWRPMGIGDYNGPLGQSDYTGGPQRKVGGFGGGSQPAVITSTTIEVVVPRALVPCIYGEDGGCLKQIRQISEAKITITEPIPGATETAIIISGAPDQTHAAQSLIQAFVMSATDSP